MNNNTVLLEPSYVLHARDFRNTSQILELFTPDHGRVSLVARGVKGPRSRHKGLLQPFVGLLVSWYGKSELMTLTDVEPNGVSLGLQKQALLCGFYINELLMRLLHRYDAHPKLFTIYQTTLKQLAEINDLQPILRVFEKQLLLELGYALELDKEAETGVAVNPEQNYFFDPLVGLSICIHQLPDQQVINLFTGSSLLALQNEDFSQKEYLRDAKRLLRIALNRLLGDKPIKSRELFV